MGNGQIGIVQIGIGQTGGGQIGGGQPGRTMSRRKGGASATRVGSGSGQIGSGQIGSGQIGSGQTGSGQIGGGQIHRAMSRRQGGARMLAPMRRLVKNSGQSAARPRARARAQPFSPTAEPPTCPAHLGGGLLAPNSGQMVVK